MEGLPTSVTAVVGVHHIAPDVWDALAQVLTVQSHNTSQWISLKQGNTDVNLYGPSIAPAMTGRDPQDEDEA